MRLQPRRVLVALAIGAAAALVALLVGPTSLADRLELATYDRRLALTAPAIDRETNVVLVHINESSLRKLEPIFGRWPLPRIVHASAIDYLARAGARVIVYDVLFVEPDMNSTIDVGGRTMTGAESDAALVAAVQRAGRVVLAAHATYEGEVGRAAGEPPRLLPPVYAPGAGFQVRPDVKLPFDALRDAALAVGHTLLVKEQDGSARRMLPFIESHGVALPSLGLAAVLAAEAVPVEDVRLEGDVLRVGTHRLPLLDDPVPPVAAGGAPQPSRQVLLNFRAQTTDDDGVVSTYRSHPFLNVLLSEEQAAAGQKPHIDPAEFKDKIVFVGVTAAGAYDVFVTPLARAGAPGVELHATLADNVLTNRFIRRASTSTGVALTIGAALIVALVATLVPVAWATAIVIAIAAGFVAVSTRALGMGVWLPVVTPLAATAVALFGGVAWQYFVEGRAKREIKGLFGRYVSKDVIDQLVADPALARLGGQRREMTVLFSDIRGFTTASERGVPEEVVLQLNEYFTVMVEVLLRHGGTLDKFVGDMVMGLFGAPLEDPRHADHAVATALDMVAALDRLNAKWKAEGRPSLDIGIGINSGEMIAGNIGSDTIMSYTVIGDAVNLGSRIESLNKEYGTRILVSQATVDRLTTPVETRRIGEVTVKGKTQPVTIFEVRSTHEEHRT